jgi:dTDP-4-dehydrorhamnose reductase
MKILLFGKEGQLGWELHRAMLPLGEVHAIGQTEADFSQPENLRGWVRETLPDVMINAAAYTAVDRAEAEPELAQTINVTAPAVLAEEAQRVGAALIHYSTDYVFDGAKNIPYLEADPPNPLSVYGRTKLEGELAVQQSCTASLVLRTSWVYSLRRASFVTKVLEWAHSQPTLKVVTDQISSPTWCRSLAEITAQLLARGGKNLVPWLAERSGVYHLAGDGYASRYEWAKAILLLDPQRETQLARQLLPARSTDFPTPAARPAFSALNCTKFADMFSLRLPDWRLTLALALAVNE